MSTPFVLAPVPAHRRRRARASSKSTSAVPHIPSGRKRSGSSASTRSRSRSRSVRKSPAPRLSEETTISFISMVDSPSSAPLSARYTATATAEIMAITSPVTANPAKSHIADALDAFGYSAAFRPPISPMPTPFLRRIRSTFSKSPLPTHKRTNTEIAPPVPAAAAAETRPTRHDIPSRKPTRSRSSRSATPARRKSKKQAVPYATVVHLNMLMDGGSEKDWLARGRSTKVGSKTEDVVTEIGGFKDEDGMIWWDEKEKWEWAALLPNKNDSRDSEWVDFQSRKHSIASDTASSPSVGSIADLVRELDDLTAYGGGISTLEQLPPRTVLAMPRPRKGKTHGQGAGSGEFLFPLDLAQRRYNGPSSPCGFGMSRANGRGHRVAPPPPLQLNPRSPFTCRSGAKVLAVSDIASSRNAMEFALFENDFIVERRVEGGNKSKVNIARLVGLLRRPKNRI